MKERPDIDSLELDQQREKNTSDMFCIFANIFLGVAVYGIKKDIPYDTISGIVAGVSCFKTSLSHAKKFNQLEALRDNDERSEPDGDDQTPTWNI